MASSRREREGDGGASCVVCSPTRRNISAGAAEAARAAAALNRGQGPMGSL